jgi:hypothetical protein
VVVRRRGGILPRCAGGPGAPTRAPVAHDGRRRERLLRYCARPPFVLDGLRELDPEYLRYERTKPGLGEPARCA